MKLGLGAKYGCSGLIAITSTVPLCAIIFLLHGWVFQLLWGWFPSPIFSVRPLTLVEAIGLVLVAETATGNFGTWIRDQKEAVWKPLLRPVIGPLIPLIVGYVVHWFL